MHEVSVYYLVVTCHRCRNNYYMMIAMRYATIQSVAISSFQNHFLELAEK